MALLFRKIFLGGLACWLAVFLTKEGTLQNLWIAIFDFTETARKKM
jgi:hypothetical protein